MKGREREKTFQANNPNLPISANIWLAPLWNQTKTFVRVL